MNQDDINELHAMLESYCKNKNYEVKHVLAFLSTVFIGTMAMHDYSEDFFDITCERMKVEFKKKKCLFGKAPI